MDKHEEAGMIWRIWVILIGMAAVLTVIYSVCWLVAAKALQAELEQRAKTAMDGVRLDFADIFIGGFPFRIAIVLELPVIATEHWSWETERLLAITSLFDLKSLRLKTNGVHNIHLGAHRYHLVGAEKHSALDLSRSGRHFSGAELRLDEPVLTRNGIDLSNGGNILLSLQKSQNGFELVLDATVELAAPPEQHQWLGANIEQLSLRLALSDRQNGKLLDSALEWGPLKADLSGEIELGDDGYFSGLLRLEALDDEAVAIIAAAAKADGGYLAKSLLLSLNQDVPALIVLETGKMRLENGHVLAELPRLF